MAYYPKDAAIMAHLRTQIKSLGVPLLFMRKFNQLMGAISVQVEDEYTSYRVIETVFVGPASGWRDFGHAPRTSHAVRRSWMSGTASERL